MRIDRLVAVAVIALAGAAVPAAAQRANQGEDESAALVSEGRVALRKGKLDDAAKALDQAIALNPRRVEAYVLRSAVYAARKQYRDGIALMRRAQALLPGDEEVLTALGSQLVLSGDLATGVPILVDVTQKNARRYDAQLLLGHHFHDTAKWTESIAAFEAYFQSRPAELANEDARHRIDLADAYLRAREPAKALALFDRAKAERPSDLRARIGVAWATAAIDCKRARPLLRELAATAEAHPEVWLVDGQCALVLGDPAGALALGRKYLDRVPKASAAGHALVGDAEAARGNLAEAKAQLGKARELEPTRRRWAVRLAIVLRRSNDAAGALAALDQIGPPDKPATDPDWWTETGEALLVKGDAAGAVAKLAPVAPQLTTDAPIHVVLGAAQLAAGDAPAAIETLTAAEAIASAPRSKKLLVEALVKVAAGKLTAGDAAGAEPLLVRADGIEGNAAVWRHLGIARLAQNQPKPAAAVLERAAKADPSPITVMLYARAVALSANAAAARPIYDRALSVAKDRDDLVEVALDWAATEVGPGGDPAVAITALERTAVPAKASAPALANRHKVALATARHAQGVAFVRAGNGGKALEALKAANAADPSLPKKCDLAVAAVVNGDASIALSALRAVSGQACPFPAPADTQAVPILIAFTEGLSRQKAAKAVDKLTSLGGRSSGIAAQLLNTSIRVVSLEAAQDAYRSGQLAQVRKYLTTAKGANTRLGADEVAHDLAVLELLEGRYDSAIAELEKVASKVPEALVNIGIAYEKKGDGPRALEAWRRAKRAGVKYPQLDEWIAAKERIYGGPAGGGPAGGGPAGGGPAP